MFTESTSQLTTIISSQLNIATIRKISNVSSKLSLLFGAISAINAVVQLNPSSVITSVSYSALAWLGFRTVSYLCTEPNDNLLNSELDTQQGLKISDKVKVVVFSAHCERICKRISLPISDVIIINLKSEVNRMEFIASKILVAKFLEYVQSRVKDSEVIEYALRPMYENIKENIVKVKLASKTLPTPIDLKLSSFIHLVVFSPKKCRTAVSTAIREKQRGQRRENSLPTHCEEGVARWERLGIIKKPGPYENSESERETKISTEIHQSDLLTTLYAIVKVHEYNEVGYDIYPSYIPYDSTNKFNQETNLSKLIRKISNYAKFLFSKSVYFNLSSDVKLIVFSPTSLADRVRKIIGENGGGLIGDYAHCSFTIGEFKAGKPTLAGDKKVSIEAVVSKSIFKTIVNALDELQDGITYSLYPLLERIDTNILRQKQNFWNALTTLNLLQY